MMGTLCLWLKSSMSDNQVAMVILLQHSNNLSTGLSSLSDPALGRAGHTAAAVVLGLILVLGFLGNFLVLMVFSRFPGLVTPVNVLLINISASDMLVCILGTPLSFAASVGGRWLTGSYGCRWYGFSNAFFGELLRMFPTSRCDISKSKSLYSICNDLSSIQCITLMLQLVNEILTLELTQ